jgi:hypothetical protein
VDNSGRRNSVEDKEYNGTTLTSDTLISYSYDNLDRLTEEKSQNELTSGSVNYDDKFTYDLSGTYDAFGNMTHPSASRPNLHHSAIALTIARIPVFTASDSFGHAAIMALRSWPRESAVRHAAHAEGLGCKLLDFPAVSSSVS